MILPQHSADSLDLKVLSFGRRGLLVNKLLLEEIGTVTCSICDHTEIPAQMVLEHGLETTAEVKNELHFS